MSGKTMKEMPQDFQFIDKVQQFLVTSKWSMTRLAKSTGVSGSALSQFLANKYPGDVEKVKEKLLSVIDREGEKATLKNANPQFTETSISKRFFETADQCRLFCDMGVCYGDAGIGKTQAAREYALRHGETILIECLPCYSPSAFLHTLQDRLCKSECKNNSAVFCSIVDKLKGSGRLIIIDEAEKLPYKTLEYIRRIHDMADIGILLVGMPELIGNLKGFNNQYRQLYSRIAIGIKLGNITEDDARAIIGILSPGDEELTKVFYTTGEHNARRMSKIIKRAAYISQINDSPVDTKTIQRAAEIVKIEVMS
jgi:DNA transposition AAA+ family ATPase